MFDHLIGFIAPHHCYSCGMNGTILCRSCVYNIVNDLPAVCFGCGVPSLNGLCPSCRPLFPFMSAYTLGAREDELERLLNDFKFNRAYRIHKTLGELLDGALPSLPANTLVVPVPTIPKHIRIRGYDHTDLIARAFARRRKLKKASLLSRKTNSVQLGADARIRREQANRAYECRQALRADIPYLLIDDIATTGATLVAAARCLKKAGAQTIIVAVIARQVLKTEKSNS